MPQTAGSTRLFSTLGSFVVLLILLLGGGSELRGQAAQPSWSGRWVADSAPYKQVLDLRQAGAAVSGDYVQLRPGESGRKGSFKGTVDGRDPRVLTGVLTLAPYTSPDGSMSASGLAQEVRWVMSVIDGRGSFVLQHYPLVTMTREGSAPTSPAPRCPPTAP